MHHGTGEDVSYVASPKATSVSCCGALLGADQGHVLLSQREGSSSSTDKTRFPLEMASGDLAVLFAATCSKCDIKYVYQLSR